MTHAAIARVASLALTASLAACASLRSYVDSPTDFTLAAPIAMAANGDRIIFKAPGESDTCPFYGGAVTFGAAPIRFAYAYSTDPERDDVVSLATSAGTLSLSGESRYSLAPPGAEPAWNDASDLDATGDRLESASGASLAISLQRAGRYLIRATDGAGHMAFSATAIPHAGAVDLTHAAFGSGVASYTGHSEHDCGNWNTPDSSASALARVESAIPPPR